MKMLYIDESGRTGSQKFLGVEGKWNFLEPLILYYLEL